AMESLHSRQLACRLVPVLLQDSSAHRRQAAARALGWMAAPGPAVSKALAACLADTLQPLSVREEAAESLAYAGNRQAISSLIDALQHQHPGLRFWAAFGLGGSGLSDIRAIQALESVLDDTAIPQGNWWSVGREALAMLGTALPPIGNYRQLLEEATQQVLQNPAATASEHRWAEAYGNHSHQAAATPQTRDV
ncbi:MAG: HEAT repeat domain-containing protein, partial [Bryobacterales bacterium]|nr:HEAT repeat domain-containing protein [Bryobacterales bacterium]